jgi:hypothetical protein
VSSAAPLRSSSRFPSVDFENGWTDFREIWYGRYAIEGFPKLVHFHFLQSLMPTWRMLKPVLLTLCHWRLFQTHMYFFNFLQSLILAWSMLELARWEGDAPRLRLYLWSSAHLMTSSLSMTSYPSWLLQQLRNEHCYSCLVSVVSKLWVIFFQCFIWQKSVKSRRTCHKSHAMRTFANLFPVVMRPLKLIA